MKKLTIFLKGGNPEPIHPSSLFFSSESAARTEITKLFDFAADERIGRCVVENELGDRIEFTRSSFLAYEMSANNATFASDDWLPGVRQDARHGHGAAHDRDLVKDVLGAPDLASVSGAVGLRFLSLTWDCNGVLGLLRALNCLNTRTLQSFLPHQDVISRADTLQSAIADILEAGCCVGMCTVEDAKKCAVQLFNVCQKHELDFRTD